VICHSSILASYIFVYINSLLSPPLLKRIKKRRSPILVTCFQMQDKWRLRKEGQAGNKTDNAAVCLLFSDLPGLPSAGSQSGCFHTFLGCKTRSLIRVYLVCPLGAKSAGTAPTISGPNLKGKHAI
jgi:hypothetical protein